MGSRNKKLFLHQWQGLDADVSLAEHSLEAFMPTNHSTTLLQHLLRHVKKYLML